MYKREGEEAKGNEKQQVWFMEKKME